MPCMSKTGARVSGDDRVFVSDDNSVYLSGESKKVGLTQRATSKIYFGVDPSIESSGFPSGKAPGGCQQFFWVTVLAADDALPEKLTFHDTK